MRHSIAQSKRESRDMIDWEMCSSIPEVNGEKVACHGQQDGSRAGTTYLKWTIKDNQLDSIGISRGLKLSRVT